MTTVADLTPRDIGKTITVQDAHSSITGMLSDLRVETDWITESRVEQHPDEWGQVRGRQTIGLSIGRWSNDNLSPDATVTFSA